MKSAKFYREHDAFDALRHDITPIYKQFAIFKMLLVIIAALIIEIWENRGKVRGGKGRTQPTRKKNKRGERANSTKFLPASPRGIRRRSCHKKENIW